MIYNYFIAEKLKYKRTFYKKLLILIPIFFVLLAYICVSKNDPQSQLFFEAMAFNWWSTLCLHLSFMLSCILSDALDRKDNKYYLMKSKGENITYIWICKIAVISVFTFILACLYLFIFWIFNLVIYHHTINMFSEIIGIFLSWLAGIWSIPLSLFLSFQFSWIITLILEFVGMILGVIFAPHTHWYLIPWSYPTRLLCPIIKIYPNGLLITDHQDLLIDKIPIVWCILLSITIYLTIISITSIYLKRREE